MLILAIALQAAPMPMVDNRPQAEPLTFQRDADFNRVTVTGAASNIGRTMSRGATRGDGGDRAAAVGNMINVTVYGSNNTVLVQARQQNGGSQRAVVATSPSILGGGR